MKWFAILLSFLTMFVFTSQQVAFSQPDSRKAKLARKSSEYPTLNSDELNWLLDCEDKAYSLVRNSYYHGEIFSRAVSAFEVDFYLDQNGKLIKLGGPYCGSTVPDAQCIQSVDDLLEKFVASVPEPPGRIRGTVTLALGVWRKDKIKSEISIRHCYVEPEPAASIDRYVHVYPPSEDQSTDKWLLDVESQLNKVFWPRFIPGLAAEIDEKEPMQLLFEISRDGWIRNVQLDPKKSLYANQMALETLMNSLPLEHRPRNLTKMPYVLKLVKQDGTVRLYCRRHAGRVVSGRIGEQGNPARMKDD